MEEWRKLTALYGEMGELEIRELADQMNDLTPAAQQILRDELKKRGISSEQSSASPSAQTERAAAVNWEPASYRYKFTKLPDENDAPHEYTWKVPLCDCETSNDAWRIAQMLKRAGIDSWIEAPEFNRAVGCSRILVGADQLDRAQVVAAQPTSQEILDEEKDLEEAPPYQIPVCPKCGVSDPTLESVEPSNNWLCESCGHTWSDPVADPPTRQ
jgi:hypothetical protein